MLIEECGAPRDSDVIKLLLDNETTNLDVVGTFINKCFLNKKYNPHKMSCSSFILNVSSDLNIIQKDSKDCYLPKDVKELCIKSEKYDTNNIVFYSNGY